MNTKTASKINWQDMTFSKILEEMNEAGQFKASFLVDSQGLPIASLSSTYDADTTSAMTTLVKNVVEQAHFRINLAEAVEVNIRAEDKSHLVCRYFSLGAETLILAVVVPHGRTYRMVTNRAIRAMTLLWSS
jgi:predicted regulator of Ras-like GTPase activity (Roadblock/LC7/MglB family)